MSLKLHSENKPLRRDPTSFLPEEEMSYEFKKKKKKKKKIQEDPFKDLEIERKHFPEVPTFALDPEVNIKVENIEVELNFDEVRHIKVCLLNVKAYCKFSPLNKKYL